LDSKTKCPCSQFQRIFNNFSGVAEQDSNLDLDSRLSLFSSGVGNIASNPVALIPNTTSVEWKLLKRAWFVIIA
jgi:hypothetical protein